VRRQHILITSWDKGREKVDFRIRGTRMVYEFSGAELLNLHERVPNLQIPPPPRGRIS
jgi:hypothetical protein